MYRTLFLLSAVLAFAPALPGWGAERDSVLPVFQLHCVKCHGQDGKIKGKVDLLAIEDLADLGRQPDLLGKVIDAIDLEEMPPEDEPRLDAKERADMLVQLEALRHETLAGKRAYPRTPIRRMNRFQYNNAVIDLFGLQGVVFSLPEQMMREHGNYFKPESGKMPGTVTVGSRPLGKSQMIERRLGGVAPFPQDLRAEHGYDNRGDHLSLSPLLMESFLVLGQSIVGSDDFNPNEVGIWKSFFAQPPVKADAKAVARERLESFLARAFRRPVEAAVLERYAEFVNVRIDGGTAFPEAMKEAAATVISSPKFLYLYDGSGAEGISDYELASRMSFFLWGSIPDRELLDCAAAGTLKNPDVLEAQIVRMMRDDKLKRFCDSFPTQWLQLERIISSLPNPEKFPDFYFSKYRNSMHMMLEPLLLFETVLIENLPVTQLIDSDFTYRSEQLESAYKELRSAGKPKGKGGQVVVLKFDRVPVTDRRNGGVITNAAVMTMTSGPDRTQPITRGAWIAGVIFNNPPEPPPANVPTLGEKPREGEEDLTLRERLALHRKRADCMGCHDKIDPLGFALENYDAVGNWRTKYENGRDVDMQGTLFRKHDFDDLIGFKDAILAEKDRFTRGLAGHLLTFALARELGSADQLAVEQIAENTAADGYKMQTLIKQVILSEPFQTKSNPKEE